jgi:hypothetical protein
MNNLIEIKQDIQPSKEMAAQLADNLLSIVNEGNANPLDALAKLKCLSLAFEQAEKKIKELALEELEKHGSKSIEINGTKFTKIETGVRYDYSNNNNWNELNQHCENAIALRKALEDKLKKIEYGHSIVNEATGEVIAAPIKTSTTSLKVELK